MENNNEPFDPLKTTASKVAKSTFQIAVEAYVKYIQTAAPFLALPVIGQIFSFSVIAFANGLFGWIANGTSGIIIDLKVDKESYDYKKAVDSLQQVIAAKKSAETIKKYDDQFKETLRKLINL